MTDTKKPILVLGGTGYVGGRLVPFLLAAGYRVRVAGRSRAKIEARSWGKDPNLEIMETDILDLPSLIRAADGCGTIYYLVHSMVARKRDYGAHDRAGAYNMVNATKVAHGLERIIYLGGLGSSSNVEGDSLELRARDEVATILSMADVPVTTLRCSVIIGSGSASFEMISYLANRMPVLPAPKWMYTQCQPISIRNVIVYLVDCLEHPGTIGKTYDVGGPDIVTYSEMVLGYADVLGLSNRVHLRLPVTVPGLSAYIVSLISPLPRNVSRILIESLRADTVCRDNSIHSDCPQRLLTIEQAFLHTRDTAASDVMQTCCYDSGAVKSPEWMLKTDSHEGQHGVYRVRYEARLRATPDEVWPLIRRIGGENGWYFGDGLWRIRGIMDKLIGGVGSARGRRDPEHLRVGDSLDFWRVLTVDEPHHLQLIAEMRVGGQAMLEMKILPRKEGVLDLQLTAHFMPVGLPGVLYWYSVYSFHAPVFKGMLKNMAKACGAEVLIRPRRVPIH